MECKLELNAAEWQLVLELLERERRELHPEIRHTDNRDFRHDLHQRLKTIDDLMNRLQAQPSTV